MTLVSGSIPNFINGVSQQAPSLRSPSQAEEQINCISSAAKGLRKRPSSLIRSLVGDFSGDTPHDDWAFHAYKRSNDEMYHIAVHGPTGAVRVTNLITGIVSNTSDSYFITDNARKNIRFLTVADYTFILNRGVTVTESTFLTTPIPLYNNPPRSDVLIEVIAGNYGKTYRVEWTHMLGSAFVFYKTANGGRAADAADIDTSNIASELETQINAILTATPATYRGWSVTRNGNTLRLTVAQSSNYPLTSITSEDGFGGNAMRVSHNVVEDFALLPAEPPPGARPFKVSPDASAADLGYYVAWVAGNSAYGSSASGQWREVASLWEAVNPPKTTSASTTRLSNGFNTATMPRALVNTAPNVFAVQVPSWGRRVVGDRKSAPDPSFVGRKITGMFFHRNRLGMLSDDGVSLSETNNFFNFYPTTVVQVLDTDRVDVKANTTVIDSFHAAEGYDKDLFVFGARTQYRLTGEPLLTAKTAEMKLVTQYDNNEDLSPVVTGSRILFGTVRAANHDFREMYLTSDGVLDAPSITGQVPEYIPGQLRHIAASTTEDMLVVCPIYDSQLYVYSWYYSGTDKLMSSWGRWQFRGSAGELVPVLHAEFLGSYLVLTVDLEGKVGTVICDVSLSRDASVEGLGGFDNVHMDFMLQYRSSFMTYDPLTDTTSWPRIAGGMPDPGDRRVACLVGAGDRSGEEIDVELVGSDYVAQGDLTGFHSVALGFRFEMLYELSPIYVRRTVGQSTVADTKARLALQRLEITHQSTAKFTVEVTPEGRSTRKVPFPREVDVARAALEGRYPYKAADGIHRVTIHSKNTGTRIVVRDDSPWPVQLLSATWDAIYSRNSKSV